MKITPCTIFDYKKNKKIRTKNLTSRDIYRFPRSRFNSFLVNVQTISDLRNRPSRSYQNPTWTYVGSLPKVYRTIFLTLSPPPRHKTSRRRQPVFQSSPTVTTIPNCNDITNHRHRISSLHPNNSHALLRIIHVTDQTIPTAKYTLHFPFSRKSQLFLFTVVYNLPFSPLMFPCENGISDYFPMYEMW